MNNYIEYLDSNYSKRTFNRKLEYIKYNFYRHLKERININVGILEVGPGMGELISFMNGKGCINIDIADNDKSIIEYIKNKYQIRKTYLVSRLDEVENELEVYDIIVATQVLEHVERGEQVSFLRFLYNHLADGGCIIITVPNMANPFTLFERYGDLTHETGFTDNSLKQLCLQSQIPLSKISIQGFSIPPYSLLNILRIGMQKALHFFILLLSIINGGAYSRLLTPNISLVIQK